MKPHIRMLLALLPDQDHTDLRTRLECLHYDLLEPGPNVLETIAEELPDLVLIDVAHPPSMPDFLADLREWSQVPVIVLWGDGQQADAIAALEAGADDAVEKARSLDMLCVRLKVALRHANVYPDGFSYQYGSLEIDLMHHQLRIDGIEVLLTPIEFALLKVLIQNAGHAVSYYDLLVSVWGEAYADELHLLRVHISNLRNKIETDPHHPERIITVSGVGYEFNTSQHSGALS